MTMTEKLDILMDEKHLNKADLSRASGIPYMTIINFYEKGTENVKRSTLLKLCKFFDVTVDFLAVDEETRRHYPDAAPAKATAGTITELPDSVVKPRLTHDITGKNLLEKENIACYDEVPPDIRCDFTISFVGNSMYKMGINDGDVIYIRKQDDVKNHEVAAVIIDGKITLRRVYRNNDQIVLMAENPAYAPVVIRGDSNIRIIGKAIAFLNPQAAAKES